MEMLRRTCVATSSPFSWGGWPGRNAGTVSEAGGWRPDADRSVRRGYRNGGRMRHRLSADTSGTLRAKEYPCHVPRRAPTCFFDMSIARRSLSGWRTRYTSCRHYSVSTMEKRDYAVGEPHQPALDYVLELMRAGCRRGVEHVAVQLRHRGCNPKIRSRYEPAGHTRDDRVVSQSGL